MKTPLNLEEFPGIEVEVDPTSFLYKRFRFFCPNGFELALLEVYAPPEYEIAIINSGSFCTAEILNYNDDVMRVRSLLDAYSILKRVYDLDSLEVDYLESSTKALEGPKKLS